MSHSRNHLNPALIIKRFKISKEDVINFFASKLINYDSKKKIPVLKLMKNEFIDDKKDFSLAEHLYTHTKSDHFIKNELYFLKEIVLEKLINATESNSLKEILLSLEPASLEKSFNDYEGKMSLLLDKHLESNFIDLSYDEKNVINKFFDSGHLRPLKYKNIEKIIKFENDDFFEYTQSLMKINKYSIMDDLDTFEECVVAFLIFINFIKKVMPDEFKYYLENYVENIPLVFEKFKNDESVDKLINKKTIYLRSDDINFILGDNVVYTLYKSEYSEIMDTINDNFKKHNLKEYNFEKISIMVLSPNNVVIQTDGKLGDESVYINKEFAMLINSLTLYSTDEWIVSNRILLEKEKIINYDFFYKLKDYDFFSPKITNLLLDLNYNVGIKKELSLSEQEKISLFLNTLDLQFGKELDMFSKIILEYIEKIIIPDYEKVIDITIGNNIINVNFIKDLADYQLLKLAVKINELLINNTEIKNNISIFICKINYIFDDKINYNYWGLNNFDRDIEYDFILIKIND